jgi:phasin
MRAFAERSFEQARQAFDGFVAAAHRTVSTFEGQAQSAQKGAKDIGQKAMAFAEQNITHSFDFAQQLVRARDVEEIMKIQGDYIIKADAGAQRAGQGIGREHQQGRQRHRAALMVGWEKYSASVPSR